MNTCNIGVTKQCTYPQLATHKMNTDTVVAEGTLGVGKHNYAMKQSRAHNNQALL